VTPIQHNHKLGESLDDVVVYRRSYRRLVGKLIYLSHPRPKIAYVVGVISQFMHNLRETHLGIVYHILQNLKGSPRKGILCFKHETLVI